MNRRTLLALVILFICALTTVGVIASIKSSGQENQNTRGECEQACTRTYQACIGASNANRAQCQRDMQACRGNCKKVSPTPTPEVSPSAEPTGTATPTP
ncbi:MAG TPA: hypothetical protein VHQ64_04710 [Pyrinomonadaceae bacterium]|nr:hypothetical protein [Pyrinomonadaceae bacterium]